MRTLTLGLLLAVCWGAGYGQSFYNKGSVVTVLPMTLFSVQDSLVNAGTLTNDGNLVMGGTWLNTGTYNAGAGEITFNSPSTSGPQVINHNNQSFSKLTISGGGVKRILADVTIEDEIILNNGVIHAENGARVVIHDQAIIAGGSDQSHIVAPVYHHGSGDKLYPLGNGAVYLPVRMLGIADPAAVVGLQGIELADATLRRGPSLTAVSDKRYWLVEVVQGTLGEAQAGLPLAGHEDLGAPEDLVVAEAPATADDFSSLGRTQASNGDYIVSQRPLTLPLITLGAQVNDGAVMVYNAVSPNGDEKNDYLVIGNIESYPDNRFTLFNRWGDKVFEINAYDNRTRVFRGQSNVGGNKPLGNGTYFYTLEAPNGLRVNGFLVLKN